MHTYTYTHEKRFKASICFDVGKMSRKLSLLLSLRAGASPFISCIVVLLVVLLFHYNCCCLILSALQHPSTNSSWHQFGDWENFFHHLHTAGTIDAIISIQFRMLIEPNDRDLSAICQKGLCHLRTYESTPTTQSIQPFTVLQLIKFIFFIVVV